jgi:hypothetical protein
MRRASANARYLVCCTALALMAALPVVTTIVMSEHRFDDRAPISASLAVATPADEAPRLDVAPPPREAGLTSWLAPLAPWALPVWSFGVLGVPFDWCWRALMPSF